MRRSILQPAALTVDGGRVALADVPDRAGGDRAEALVAPVRGVSRHGQ